jgi:YidC/Oxa1 family membrane protein insertase
MKKELSPELRIVLAFALSFVILLISRPLLVRQTSNEPDAAPPAGTPAPAPAPAAPAQVAQAPGAVVPSQPTQAQAAEEIVVEGNLYRVVFSTQGAVVRSWTLKGYQDAEGNPLELVNQDAAARYGSPLSIWTAEERLREQVNSALFLPSQQGTIQAPAALEFQYNDGAIAARKRLVFSENSYAVEIETDLASEGKAVSHELAWRGSFGDIHEPALAGAGHTVFYREPARVTRLKTSDVEVASSTVTGPFAFAGIEDHFFTAAFLPAQGSLRVTAFKDEITLPGRDQPTPSLGVAVGNGDAPQNRFRLFVGPKHTETLASIDPRFPELVDYGWFAFVAKPLFVALRWIHDNVVSNYGWAIILLTIVINMALFPLKISSLRSAMKMQKLQPQLRAIQDKYKHLKLKDPRRHQMSQETMALYKKHGVNPIGGCLPMLLQIPFLYGFYKVLVMSIEMRHAPWISWWVPDLSAAEPHAIKFLPLLMCATQFALQKMSPTPSADPTQQKIMLFMPVMFLVFFWGMSSGLVLYWLTGNLVGIAQQVYINRTEMRHLVEERRAAVRKKRPATQK